MAKIRKTPITPGSRPLGPAQNVEVKAAKMDEVIDRLNDLTDGTDVTVSGDLQVDGSLNVDGAITANGSTITLGDTAGDNVVFGADVNSHIIPNTDNTYDLGSGSQEWRNIYVDGTANIDTLSSDIANIAGDVTIMSPSMMEVPKLS